MEFMNKIEVQGIVGRSTLNTYNGKTVCNFSVVTEHASNDREGNILKEVQWFNATVWEGGNVKDADIRQIEKGGWIHVSGMMRSRKYTTQEGEEKVSWYIAVQEFHVLK